VCVGVVGFGYEFVGWGVFDDFVEVYYCGVIGDVVY